MQDASKAALDIHGDDNTTMRAQKQIKTWYVLGSAADRPGQLLLLGCDSRPWLTRGTVTPPAAVAPCSSCTPVSAARDRKKNKFVGAANDKKMMRTESGHKIPMTYKSDRYKEWAEKNNATRCVGDPEARGLASWSLSDRAREARLSGVSGGELGSRRAHVSVTPRALPPPNTGRPSARKRTLPRRSAGLRPPRTSGKEAASAKDAGGREEVGSARCSPLTSFAFPPLLFGHLGHHRRSRFAKMNGHGDEEEQGPASKRSKGGKGAKGAKGGKVRWRRGSRDLRLRRRLPAPLSPHAASPFDKFSGHQGRRAAAQGDHLEGAHEKVGPAVDGDEEAQAKGVQRQEGQRPLRALRAVLASLLFLAALSRVHDVSKRLL